MEAALTKEVGRAGPKRNGREALVGKTEVAPDQVEIHQTDGYADCEKRHGDGQAAGYCNLGLFDGFSYNQTGGAEGGIARSNG